MASSLVKYAQGLPSVRTPTSTYSVLELVDDLIGYAKSNMTSNTVVVPVFQTFTILLEADVLRHIVDEPSGLKR